MTNYRRKRQNPTSIKELPPHERPRERLGQVGSQALSDIELLTILLGSGCAGRSAQIVAADVLHFLDQMDASNELHVQDLCAISGVGKAKSAVICAALELGRRRLPLRRKQIVYPSDVFPLIQHYGSRNQEHFLVIALNGAHEVITINVVSIGLVNHTLVHPREVFSDALKERATAIIVAHNHPSGILKPSEDDINVTSRLIRAGEILGIKVLDHLIFSSDSFRSMLEKDEME